jgi:hypothetical protein
MLFIYGELPAARRRELQAHLDVCPACSSQVQAWRLAMTALDAWKLPVRRPRSVATTPALTWAAAAAAVLVVGFLLGRQTSSSASEIAALKSSVAELSAVVQKQSETTVSKSVVASTTEVARLLTDYSQVQEEQRAVDRQRMNLALRTVDLRLNRIQNDLETVAINTETGFQETHENITKVASYSLASKN